MNVKRRSFCSCNKKASDELLCLQKRGHLKFFIIQPWPLATFRRDHPYFDVCQNHFCWTSDDEDSMGSINCRIFAPNIDIVMQQKSKRWVGLFAKKRTPSCCRAPEGPISSGAQHAWSPSMCKSRATELLEYKSLMFPYGWLKNSSGDGAWLLLE